MNGIKKFKVCGTGKRELLKSKVWYPSTEIEDTQDRLLKELAGLDRLLISYSGGVDSTLLAVLSKKALHNRAKCILFDAPIIPRRAIDDAAEIRQMAQDCGFDFWNKPSASCLASRIPYREEITVEKLQKVENILRDLGFSNLRVRLHGKIARIELIPEELEKAVNLRHRIVELLQDCGFSYITLDLKGYRSGSMDEVLWA